MTLLQRLLLSGMIIPGLTAAPALAQTSNVFELGTIYLGAEDEQGQGGTHSAVTGEQAAKTNRNMLNDTVAVLPGVSSIMSSGGSRNEAQVFVRGFNRWHVPLSIDGIRIYLPADNRLDYGRFLTPDLAEVEVQKGYVSVLNGPGGMGGAINLVTKKPTEAFEGTARLGVEAGNRGDISARSGYLSLGTRQELFYVQGSYLRRNSDGFYLSRDFKPNPAYPYQRGGLRNYSDTDDSRLNLKFGYTPNATDEYVLSYTRQSGEKNAPYSVALPVRGVSGTGAGSVQRDWTWPEWDTTSLAFYSHTDLDGAYVKTKLYYNTFDNTLSAWDDYLHQSQTARRAFNSVYDDYSAGASVEVGTTLADHDLKFAAHFRRDVHESINYPTPTLGNPADPTERSKEETWSIAVEDSWRISSEWRVVGGLSYDKARVIEADRTNTSAGYPRVSSDAVNWQLATIWTPASGGEYHASISSRTSFPTLFHRYSTRFDTFVPNPDLDAERATNVELGYKGDLGPVQLEGAVFYSRVSDLIQAVYQYTDTVSGDDVSQQQNVGKGTYKGFEVAAGWQMSDSLNLTANYTYMSTSIDDPSINGLRITDIPRHKAYIRLDWQALDALQVSPSVEIYGARWSDPAIGSGDAANPIYTRMGGFALANLDFSWQARPQVAVDFGIRNMFDRNVEEVEGYPLPGRTFYLMSEVKF